MTVIAYVPAYHRGYSLFFAKYAGPIYVLATDVAQELRPKLERDMRALPALDMVAALRAQWSDVHILDKEALPKLDDSPIFMPDEDISHAFAEAYLKSKDVTFVPTHLRWDGQWATKETPVPPGRTVSKAKLDKNLIANAKQAAERSPDWWRQVGAIITKNGKPLLTGYNRSDQSDIYELGAMGDPRSNFDAGVSYDLTTAEHGEAHLIATAANKGISLQGTSIYVTTFPCPTCAKLIATAGIAKVYYAEGYSLVDAEATLRDAGIEIILVKD